MKPVPVVSFETVIRLFTYNLCCDVKIDHKTIFQDKLVFWFFLYIHPLAWATIGVFAAITFSAFEVKKRFIYS